MELRSQSRTETDEPVKVTVLGECEAHFSGRITNFSSYGIGLMLESPIAIGAAVKVEWINTLLLGEVCRCQSVAGGFCVGLQLEHALYNTLQLAEFAKRILDEGPAAEVEGSKKR
jgi:hypothetical protein